MNTLAKAGASADVRYTQYAGHARELAASDEISGYAALAVFGGDGTIREVAAGLLSRGGDPPPLAVLPGGSGNSLSQDLGAPGWPAALARVTGGSTRACDAVRIVADGEVTYAVNLVGWAAAAEISRIAEGLRWMGAGRYTWSALWQVCRARPCDFELAIDGRNLPGPFTLALACNTRFCGKGMLAAPQALLDDGRLDLMLVRRASRLQMLAMFQKVFSGRHVELPCVEMHTPRRIEVRWLKPASLSLDGDVRPARHTIVEVLPSALQFLVDAAPG